MSSDYSPGSSRRGTRQGARRRGGRTNRGSERPTQSHRQTSPSKKPTLWQKITSFFAGDSESPAPKGAAERPAQRPARSEGPQGREESARPRTQRKPESVEVTTPRVYVGNLSFDATESDLLELFGGVGAVQTVEIVANKHNQRSKGFGFVQLQTIDEAKRAVEVLHDKEYMGRKLVVSGAKAAEERRAERSIQPEQ